MFLPGLDLNSDRSGTMCHYRSSTEWIQAPEPAAGPLNLPIQTDSSK